VTCLRVRARSLNERLRPEDRKLLFTTANALLTSMAGFLVGGSFLALALNDVTWLTFGMVAAVDRLSVRMIEEPAEDLVPVRVPPVPLAFRAVESFSHLKAGRV
jgi:hypothetical protein